MAESYISPALHELAAVGRHVVRAELAPDGGAKIQLGTRTLAVSRRDEPHVGLSPSADAPTAICPLELVIAALASCMVMTMAAVAEAKGICCDDLAVVVRVTPADNGAGARFETEIHLPASLNRREQIILYNSARSCEVHHLLSGPIEFRDSLVLS